MNKLLFTISNYKVIGVQRMEGRRGGGLKERSQRSERAMELPSSSYQLRMSSSPQLTSIFRELSWYRVNLTISCSRFFYFCNVILNKLCMYVCIFSHLSHSGHTAPLDDFKILSSCSSPDELHVRESLLISKL